MKTKNKLLILLVMLIPIITIGQKNISELTSNAVEATENLNLDLIYDLDVFEYFSLTDYNTALKIAVFKKTNEYQNYLNELKNKRIEILKTNYYSKFTKMFEGKNYDIKRRGFEIHLGINFFFKINEEDGLEIENNSDEIVIYYFFKLSDNKDAGLRFYLGHVDWGDSGFIFNYPNKLTNSLILFHKLKSEKVEVVVANKVTGKIYYIKTYSNQTKSKIKK